MGPESILLSVDRLGEEGFYSFVCPVCLEDVQKQADRKIVALLVSAGVAMGEETAPAAGVLLQEAPAEVPDAPAFTLDDLIHFHYVLDDDEALHAFFSDRG